jgi:hypothetical protein
MNFSRFRSVLMVFGCTFAVLASLVASGAAAGAATAPRVVSVTVVPALAGVQFTLDGVAGVTGPGGTATVADSNLAGAAAGLTVPAQQLTSNLRVSLDRVANDPNHGSFSRSLVAELDEDRAVTVRMITPQRKVLPIAQVSKMTLSDSIGRTIHLSPKQLKGPIWLASSRPTQVHSGVANRLVTYSVKSVMIRGTNVVNIDQLRFTAGSLAWNIPVILHSLTVVGNDLLAARPAGKRVTLTYPNLTKVTVPFGPDHRVTITDLPRGTYKVKVSGGIVALASSVRLSRDQTATEIVVTGGDVAEITALILVAAAVVAAAGVIGRRRRQLTGRTEGITHATLPA